MSLLWKKVCSGPCTLDYLGFIEFGFYMTSLYILGITSLGICLPKFLPFHRLPFHCWWFLLLNRSIWFDVIPNFILLLLLISNNKNYHDDWWQWGNSLHLLFRIYNFKSYLKPSISLAIQFSQHQLVNRLSFAYPIFENFDIVSGSLFTFKFGYLECLSVNMSLWTHLDDVAFLPMDNFPPN